MERSEKTVRFTIDLPANIHKRLKVLAVQGEVSMRELVIVMAETIIAKSDISR